MPKRAVFERSCRELSLDVSVGVHISLVVEQSSPESQSRGCAKTPILEVYNKFSSKNNADHRRADDTGRDSRTCLARPNSSQAPTGTKLRYPQTLVRLIERSLQFFY